MPRLRFTPPPAEPQLPRATRKQCGIYYTPPEMVRLVVELTLTPDFSGERPPRVLDPACGAGEFLLEVQRVLQTRYDVASSRTAIHGVDIDRAAIRQARRRLRAADAEFPAGQLVPGDFLETSLLPSSSFDAIVGNPPYVNIRQLAKSMPKLRIDQLRRDYETARGNFDLFVLFIERAAALLRPGGRCGLIVPNKWATLDYALPCRELLLRQTTLEHVVDLADIRPFARAAVYPQVLVFRKMPPRRGHAVVWRELQPAASPGTQGPAIFVRQIALSAGAVSFAPRLDIESRTSTQPLGAVAMLTCGTAGYAAQRLARRLIDGEPSPGAAEFITSGNIERYEIELGNVRFLNRTYRQPWLPLDIPELTAARRRLFRSSKIVIAGLSRRLEAAFDEQGLALGVQVFAAADCQVEPLFLLGLLNSKLLSYVFATRYAAKRLGGNYLAINKGQLKELPICAMSSRDPRRQRLIDLAQQRNALTGKTSAEATNGASSDSARCEHALDELVYELYRLTAAEIATVEAHFETGSAKAA